MFGSYGAITRPKTATKITSATSATPRTFSFDAARNRLLVCSALRARLAGATSTTISAGAIT